VSISPPPFSRNEITFPLYKRAKAATERAWETYITKRVAADKKFSGAKEKKSKSPMGGDEKGGDDEL
jgi:hypothetical protein